MYVMCLYKILLGKGIVFHTVLQSHSYSGMAEGGAVPCGVKETLEKAMLQLLAKRGPTKTC